MGNNRFNATYINEAAKTVDLYRLRTEQNVSSNANFRISPEPFSPPKAYTNQMRSYSRILTKLYNQCREMHNLPDHWKKLIGQFQHEEQGRHLFIRPDFVMTEEGLHCVEIETSPFGFGLSVWLENCYRSLGFKVAGSDLWHELFPNNLIFLTSSYTNQYDGQLKYISDQLKAYRKNTTVMDVDHPAEICDSDILYRAFYLYEKGHDFNMMQSRHFPPNELFLETKLPLALAWDDSIKVDPIIREIILPTWVVKEGFPCPRKSWMDIPELSAKDRRYVLKLAGCEAGSSWGEGVHFLHKISREKCIQLLQDALNSEKLYILQAFVDGKKFEQPWYDFGTGTEQIMNGRVRLTPYVNTLTGDVISAKIAMREHTDFIHSSSDAVVTAVA